MGDIFKHYLVYLFILGVLTIKFFACTRVSYEVIPAHAKEMIVENTVGKVQFKVEIADSPRERSRGLMYREELPENRGMFFIFEKTDFHPFWMKDTFIPLDIIFFNEDLRVVGIIENTKPEDLSLLNIGVKSRYALEVNAGIVKKHGIGLNSNAFFINR